MSETDLLQRAGAQAETISRAEFARRLGISRAAVSQGIARDRLDAAAFSDASRAKLSWPEAARQWNASADPQASLKDQPQGAAPAQEAAEAPAGKGAEVENLPGYRSQKERQARIQADLAEVELNRKLDRYRDKDEVERAMVTCGRAIRTQLEAVELWAGDLAQLTGGDAQEIRGLLREKSRELQQRAAETLAQFGEADTTDPEDDGDAAVNA